MRKLVISIIVFALLNLLGSCTLINRREPLPALVDSPCVPPCWQGIIPGESSKEEVEDLSADIPGIDLEYSKWLGSWNIYDDRFLLQFKDGKGEGQIRIVDNYIHSISIYDDVNLTLEQAIGLYGEPESIIIEHEEPGDVILLSINLLYPNQGLLLTYSEGDYGTAHIQPGKMIEWVVFVDPKRYGASLTEGPAYIEGEAFRNNRYPWSGYENIEFER
jgi:hypothetical protein